MGRTFVAAQDAKTVPVTSNPVFDAAEVFIVGAVIGRAADGEAIELSSGAGVAASSVIGVSLEAAGSRPGNNVANDNTVVFRTGVENRFSMVDLTRNPHQVFTGRLTDGAGVDVLPTQTMIGESRGLLRLANGEWVVNNADVTNDAVQIVDIVLSLGAAAAGNYVKFIFLPAVIAEVAA